MNILVDIILVLIIVILVVYFILPIYNSYIANENAQKQQYAIAHALPNAIINCGATFAPNNTAPYANGTLTCTAVDTNNLTGSWVIVMSGVNQAEPLDAGSSFQNTITYNNVTLNASIKLPDMNPAESYTVQIRAVPRDNPQQFIEGTVNINYVGGHWSQT